MANISINKQKNLLTISVLATVLTLTPQYAFAQLAPVEDMVCLLYTSPSPRD